MTFCLIALVRVMRPKVNHPRKSETSSCIAKADYSCFWGRAVVCVSLFCLLGVMIIYISVGFEPS